MHVAKTRPQYSRTQPSHTQRHAERAHCAGGQLGASWDTVAVVPPSSTAADSETARRGTAKRRPSPSVLGLLHSRGGVAVLRTCVRASGACVRSSCSTCRCHAAAFGARLACVQVAAVWREPKRRFDHSASPAHLEQRKLRLGLAGSGRAIRDELARRRRRRDVRAVSRTKALN